MTHEEVDNYENYLREAEKMVEKAAQAICDVPQNDVAVQRLWLDLNQTLSLIGRCINRSSYLRPIG